MTQSFLRRIIVEGVSVYRSPALEGVGAAHGFSTRMGGVSAGAFASLNLGNPSTGEARDSLERIGENWQRFNRAAGVAGRAVRRVTQVHGCGVVDVDGREELTGVSADAIVSGDAGCAAAVRVADCAPVLLASGDGRIVAAVHAGWRGVVAGVVGAAVERMRQRGAASIVAAIGPCIGFEAFEVGAEVLEAFGRLFPADAPVRENGGGKGWVDLREAVRRQLVGAGVRAAEIDSTDRCTVRDAGEFFSHRRENGVTGRMAAVIAPA